MGGKTGLDFVAFITTSFGSVRRIGLRRIGGTSIGGDRTADFFPTQIGLKSIAGGVDGWIGCELGAFFAIMTGGLSSGGFGCTVEGDGLGTLASD